MSRRARIRWMLRGRSVDEPTKPPLDTEQAAKQRLGSGGLPSATLDSSG